MLKKWAGMSFIGLRMISWIIVLNFHFFFRFLFEMESTLFKACHQGNVSIVKEILESVQAKINCTNIRIQKEFVKFNFIYLMIFQFQNIYGIKIQYLILLLWFVLQKMVIPKLFDFYYRNQVLKSTSKAFEYQNHSQYLNFIISLYFSFKSFMELQSDI